MEHSEALAGSSQQIWLARVFNHPMSQKVSHETNGSYSMYKETEKGGRSVAAGGSNFSTNTKLPSLTWIRGLVNCLEGSSSGTPE